MTCTQIHVSTVPCSPKYVSTIPCTPKYVSTVLFNQNTFFDAVLIFLCRNFGAQEDYFACVSLISALSAHYLCCMLIIVHYSFCPELKKLSHSAGRAPIGLCTGKPKGNIQQLICSHIFLFLPQTIFRVINFLYTLLLFKSILF